MKEGHVLVVDDEPMIRETLARLLEAEGYMVDLAIDGVTALERVRAVRPDAILLNLMMNGMNGMECLKRLRAEPAYASVPVMITTACHGLELHFAAYGDTQLIELPFDVDDLLNKVALAVDRSRESNPGPTRPRPSAPELRRELLRLLVEGEAAWLELIEMDRRGYKANWKPVHAIEEKVSKALKAIIAKYGWPGKTLVGEDGAHAAGLLVHYAGHDLALQKDVLARMKPMVDSGEVTKIDYAYLEDRVAVAEHRKQRYGTQFKKGEPQPIEDEANVDVHRKEIGLGTMAEYRQEWLKMYGPKAPTATPKK